MTDGVRHDVAFRLGTSTYGGETRIDMLVEDMRVAG